MLCVSPHQHSCKASTMYAQCSKPHKLLQAQQQAKGCRSCLRRGISHRSSNKSVLVVAAAGTAITEHASAAAAVCRRQVLQASSASLLLPLVSWPGLAAAQEEQPAVQEAAAASTAQLQPYINSQQQYRLDVPSDWERKDKAGADVLFEDPSRRSTSVGVTVSPVRVSSIEQFGSLDAVGQRLLDVERKKESTLGASLLASSSRTGAGGATLYDYEYELDSTRGVKRIFNTVTITGSKLYILNGNFKCDKEAGCAAAEAGPIATLRQVAATFDAGSNSQ